MSDEFWPILCVLIFSMGCHQSAVSEDDDDDPDESDEVVCQVDDDCEGYHRCIDEDCTVPPAITGERDDDTPVATFFDEEGQKLASFYLELAITPEEQSRGLMYRTEMRDDWGMLFVYAHDQNLSFWMKNTLISLDMIFVDTKGDVVGVVEEATPETTTPRGVGEPSRYVLEINGGLASQHDIERGTTMSLDHVDESYQLGQ